MKEIRCPDLTCGVVFGVPDHVYAQANDIGGARKCYCPNGHPWQFAETDNDRLRQQIVRLEESLSAVYERRDRLRDQRDTERRKNAALRGVITKLRALSKRGGGK